MVTKGVLALLVVGLAFLALTPSGTRALTCCYAVNNGMCADCSKPIKTSWDVEVCGVGSCSVIGCNCAYGCRKAPKGGCSIRKAREAVNDTVGQRVTGNDVVKSADANGDGKLEETEVLVYLKGRGVVLEVDSWRSLDANHDGFLTAHEIDTERDGDEESKVDEEP